VLRTPLEQLHAVVGAVDVAALARPDRDGRLGALDELAGSVLEAVSELAEVAELGYFAQVGPGTVVGDERWGA
jgi:hypothetical protein